MEIFEKLKTSEDSRIIFQKYDWHFNLFFSLNNFLGTLFESHFPQIICPLTNKNVTTKFNVLTQWADIFIENFPRAFPKKYRFFY